jgi:hypothetical protein
MVMGKCSDPDMEAERIRKIKEARRTQPPPTLGMKFTEEHRMKMSLSQRGKKKKPLTEEAKRHLSEINRGERHPQYGKRRSEETKRRISMNRRGIGHSEETRRKMAVSRVGLKAGDKNHFWKGGVSFEPYCPKFNNAFRERVREFFGRVCVECGTPENGTKLCVHHVNFNKMTCCDDTRPLFVALCPSCHARTNHNREYWEEHFTNMVINYYEGRCYI